MLRFVEMHRAVFLLAAALALSGGCNRQLSGEPGTVNFLIESMPLNLDPRFATDAQSQRLDGLLFSSLVGKDVQMNAVPDLAERWETPDPVSYVFHLREGVRFHNGQPLTSADVKFTFDSILSGSLGSPKQGSFPMVASVAAPDDHRIVFHLKQPYASFLWDLTRPGIGIVPRDAGREVSTHPVGTGPFRFVRSLADEEVLLERNPDYFGPAPKIERVRFRVVPDATVRALELRKGSADIELSSLTPDMVVALARDPNLAAMDESGTDLAYICYNLDYPVLAKRELRQALAYATDRATLIRYLLRGQARAATSLLPPNHWAFEPNLPRYDYDPQRAEKFLDSAGFFPGPDGVRLRITLKTSTDESTRILAEAIQDEWRKVGVALEIRPLEFQTFTSDINQGSFQLFTQRWIGGNNDPDLFEFVFSSKKFPPAGRNRGHYRNPELDTLLDRARAETNREKRKQILWRVQEIIAEDQPYLNLWYLDNVCVHRKRITNLAFTPAGDFDFLTTMEMK